MSGGDAPNLRAVFDELIELPPGDREAALADLAARHPDLAAEVRAILPSGDTSGSDDPIAGRVLRSMHGAPPLQGQVGPYRLLRLLGAGGMGWVYLAERDADGVRQQVALKLVRGSGDAGTDELFRRERAVLASLHHPNIARFLDAGSVGGQRYLVMEHVAGQALGSWLAERQPTLRQRLDLLVALAKAVDHAHANLVVHRDLKPANLLVRADGSPVLLDFGIAKLLDAEDPARVTSTRIYTPTYAAPEQVAGRPVTVATDVYGLGLLLFELLCGEPARGAKDDAPRTKASRVAQDSDLPWVRRDASGINVELDRIVAMALREEPERRYRSAADLVADLERWQRGLPVLAMPDSLAYRSRKWLGRHRIGALVAATALVATVFFVVQLNLARQRALLAEQEAERKARTAQAVADLMTDLFRGADPKVARNADLSARALLERGAARFEEHRSGDPAIDAQLRFTVGQLLAEIGDPATAVAQFDAALALDPPDPLLRAEVLHERSRALDVQNFFPESEGSARAALALREAALGPDASPVAHSVQTLGVAVQKQGRVDEAEALFLRAEAVFGAQQPPDLEGLASARHNLAWVAQRRGDMVLAATRYRQVVRDKTALYGAEDPRTLGSAYGLAQVMAGQGAIDEAIHWMEKVLSGRRQMKGDHSLDTVSSLNELGMLRLSRGDLDVAQSLLSEGLAHAMRVAPDSADVARLSNNLGLLHEMRGDIAAAVPHYRNAIQIRHALFGPANANSLRAEHNHCRAIGAVDPGHEARVCAADILARRQRVLPAGDPEIDDSRALVERHQLKPDRAWLLERFNHYRAKGPSELTRSVRFAWVLAEGGQGTADDLDRLAALAAALREAQGPRSLSAATSEMYLARLALSLGKPELAHAAWLRARDVLEAALVPEADQRVVMEALRTALDRSSRPGTSPRG